MLSFLSVYLILGMGSFWSDDVVIVTFDDDKKLTKSALLRLVTYYIDSNKQSIVGLRVRRIGTARFPTVIFGSRLFMGLV
jgi:hypothetical protein